MQQNLLTRKVLLVDDDSSVLNALGDFFEFAAQMASIRAGSYKEAMAHQAEIFSGDVELAILDINLLTMGWVLTRVRKIGDGLASLIFAMNLIPVFVILWFSGMTASGLEKFWVPFQAHELSCLTIAILAPPKRAVGILAILLIPVLAFLQFRSFSVQELAYLPDRPMVAPIAFAAFALVLYLFRIRGIEITSLVAKSDAETAMMKKLNRTILALKDLTNSPLQSLTLDAEILKRMHPETGPVASRVEKSVAQLTDLNRILDQQLRGSAIESEDVSFDPYDEIRAILRPE